MQKNVTSFLHSVSTKLDRAWLPKRSTGDCHGGDVNLTNPSAPTSPVALQPQRWLTLRGEKNKALENPEHSKAK